MSALAAITINDGQASPAPHTFSPARITERGTAKYYDRSGGTPVLYPEIHISLYEPVTITSRMKAATIDKLAYKANVKVLVPVADITAPASGTGIEPAPSKAYDCSMNCTFTLPVRSSLAARKDLLAYVRNLLATSVVTSLVHDTEGVY